MNMAVNMDTRNWRAAAARLAAKVPKEIRSQVLVEESKQFVKAVNKVLPPRTLAQGRAAAKGDIDRAVWAPKPNSPQIRSPRLRQIIQSRDINAMNAFTRNAGRFKGWRVEAFTPRLHTSQRNSRGRVPKVRRVISLDWSQQSAYVANMQQRVGILKSGNNATLRAFGISVPSWLARHGTKFSDHSATAGDKPTITMTHRGSKVGSAAQYESVFQFALKSRQRIMLQKMDRIVKGQATNLGFTTI